jgi:hypothetical protein
VNDQVEVGAVSSRRKLADLVGAEAASLSYQGFHWQIFGLAVFVVGIGLLVALATLGAPVPGWAILLPLALLVVGEVRAAQLYLQGRRAANSSLSEGAGFPIRVTGFALQPRVWQRQIDKAVKERSGEARTV